MATEMETKCLQKSCNDDRKVSGPLFRRITRRSELGHARSSAHTSKDIQNAPSFAEASASPSSSSASSSARTASVICPQPARSVVSQR